LVPAVPNVPGVPLVEDVPAVIILPELWRKTSGVVTNFLHYVCSEACAGWMFSSPLIQTRIPGSARRAAGRRVRKGNEVYCPRIFFQPRQERSLAKRIENEGKIKDEREKRKDERSVGKTGGGWQEKEACEQPQCNPIF
jgi:hypothetical protein